MHTYIQVRTVYTLIDKKLHLNNILWIIINFTAQRTMWRNSQIWCLKNVLVSVEDDVIFDSFGVKLCFCMYLIYLFTYLIFISAFWKYSIIVLRSPCFEQIKRFLKFNSLSQGPPGPRWLHTASSALPLLWDCRRPHHNKSVQVQHTHTQTHTFEFIAHNFYALCLFSSTLHM